jgi:hypothetical protein
MTPLDAFRRRLVKDIGAKRFSQSDRHEYLSSGLVDEHLNELISILLRCDGVASELCAHSTLHKNGFLRVMILDARPKFAIRLHVWQSKSRIVSPDVHNHPWDASSKVVVGQLVDVRHIVEPGNGEHYFAYGCQYVPGRDGHIFTPNGDCFLAASRQTLLTRNDGPYELCFEDLHSTTSGADLTATLFFHGPLHRTKTSVFSKLEKRNLLVDRASPVTVKYLKEALTRISSTL